MLLQNISVRIWNIKKDELSHFHRPGEGEGVFHEPAARNPARRLELTLQSRELIIFCLVMLALLKPVVAYVVAEMRL